MKDITFNGYKRISKPAARKIYNDGGVIRLVPCNIRPVNYWDYYADAQKDQFTQVDYDGFNATVARNKEFETVVNAFTYYNCNSETGKYPAFYIKEAA